MTFAKTFIAGFTLLAAVANAAARLTSGPELEESAATITIIRWTTTNPGATDLHFGIVHFGTEPDRLTQVARSPNRRNQSHADMTFRVRIDGLRSHTTYYYTVESTDAMGRSDGVASSVGSFKTK